MRKLLFLAMSAGFAFLSYSQTRQIEVAGAPFPFAVNEWTPPEKEFPVTSYGAAKGGAPITESIEKAIAAAHDAGGGKVVIPEGEWLSGAFRMKSNVALCLKENSVLRFPDDPVVVYRAPLRSNGRPTMTAKGLVEAQGCTNVAIMGAGTLKADVEYWHRNFLLNPERGFPRPQFFHFSKCKNVRFEGFKVRGSPAWTMHFSVCDNIILRNVDSVCSGPNTDGIDLESCDTALVEGCSLDQTDDTYTIKSGRNEAGRKRNIPTQNVVIRNCRAVQGHALLAIGSEVSGGIRNIWMDNCTVEAECWNWLFVKTNSKRGAFVENVLMENIRGRRATGAVVNIEMFYDGNPNKELTAKGGQAWCTRIEGITARNVLCEEAGCAVKVTSDGRCPPKRIAAENISVGRLRNPASKSLNRISNTDDVSLKNVKIDPGAAGEVLRLPRAMKVLGDDAESYGSKELVFERDSFEELSENEIVKRVLLGRIEKEVSTDRNCLPAILPSRRDDVGETLANDRTRRIWDCLADMGCALQGAIVQDGVMRVAQTEKDGLSEKYPGLSFKLEISRDDDTAVLTIENKTSGELNDISGVLLLPPERMTRRHVFSVPRLKPNEKTEKTFPLGVIMHVLPQAVGENLYAACIDFTSGNVRSRLWTVHREAASPLGFLPPAKAARYVEPADVGSFDVEALRLASKYGAPLPSVKGREWKSPCAEGASWFNVTSFSRPYSGAEAKLLKADRLREAFAMEFDVPEKVNVKMRLLSFLWDKKPLVFFNGEKIDVNSKVFALPAKTGPNRLVVCFRSKPGNVKACTQCPVYVWGIPQQLNCLEIPSTQQSAGKEAVKDKRISFPLEWDARRECERPHEVEISRKKMSDLLLGEGALSFKVFAAGDWGEKEIPVATLPGRVEDTVRLRFRPPAGTGLLSCEVSRSGGKTKPYDGADDIFAGCLTDISKWKLTPRCKAETSPGGGLVIGARDFGAPEAEFRVKVPEGLAGRMVVLDAEMENIGKEAVQRVLRIIQYDKNGKKIPESVVDRRWTTHACPPGEKMRYLERGVIHPQAAEVSAKIIVSSPVYPNDIYGLPQKLDRARLAKHLITRLSLREALTLPFPKYDDSFFAEGVSGEKGDSSLVLGGVDEKAFWYQTRSNASWSDGVNLRGEDLVYFPSGNGTLEAWFKSPWKKGSREYVLFESYQGFRASEARAGRGRLISLSCNPSSEEIKVFFKEPTTRKEWSKTARVKLPAGKWFHVALQWEVKDKAEVFVDGVKVTELPIPEWRGCDLLDESIKRPNDENAQEFFLGSAAISARVKSSPEENAPFFEGSVDLFRASSGKRYNGNFTPSKSFGVDKDTRALFSFDRSFDGVSGGGAGWIPGSIRSLKDRVDHFLSLDGGRKVQYFPSSPVPENDPSVVFDIVNYRDLPGPEDFEAMRKRFEHVAVLSRGESISFDAPSGVTTEFTEIENVSDEPLVLPVVINSGELDPRSWGDIRDSLDLAGLSPKERADKVFQLVLSATDYFQIHSAKFKPKTDIPFDTEYDCMTMLNGYCGFECGPMNHLTANLFVFAGDCPASETAGYGHQFEQVFYGGKNHIYDLSAQQFFPAMDNETAAYLEEAGDQPGIFNRLGKSAENFIRMGHRGFWGIGLKTPDKIGLTLHKGEKFRVWQVNDGNCNDLICDSKTGVYRGGKSKWKEDMDEATHADTSGKYLQRVERYFPHYINGFLMFDGVPEKTNAAFSGFTEESFCYRVNAGGYPVTAASYCAFKKGGEKAEIEISTDGGLSYRPLVSPAFYQVRARMEYLVRVKCRIEDIERFSAVTELQLNQRVFPGKIRPGKNEFTLKAVSGGKAKVRIAGRERKSRVKVEGKVVHSGTVKGAELLFTAFDSSDVRRLAVKGIGEDFSIAASGNVKASLENGMLVVEAKDKNVSAFGAVTISSQGAEKTIAVFSGPGVRFATPDDAVISGSNVFLRESDKTSPQKRIEFSSKGTGEALFDIGDTPKGRYAVFNLNRFVSHPEANANDDLRMIWTGQKRKSYGCGSPRNKSCNFRKANYGRKGERANFKWDYIYRDDSWELYQSLMTIDVPASRTVKMFSWRNDPVEVAALLVVPDPSKETRSELIKILCGFNTTPWRIPENLNPAFLLPYN